MGRYIINDQEAGLTNCSYGVKKAIDLQGKSVTIDKNLKRVGEAVPTGMEDSGEIAPVTKKPRRERQGGDQPLCFFCGHKGHRAREFRTETDKWVEIDKLPAAVQGIAEKVRQAAKRE